MAGPSKALSGGTRLTPENYAAFAATLETEEPVAAGVSWFDESAGVVKISAGIPPVVTLQPTSTEILPDATATFTVAATNATSYQWQLDTGSGFEDIEDADSASYTTPVQTLANDGDEYRCVVTGPGGVKNSNTVVLSVTDDLDNYLLAHWRADNITGSSGSYVIEDLTANGYDLTQASGTASTATGVNSQAKLSCTVAANFEGTETIASRYNKTIITVFKRTGTTRTGLFGPAGTNPFYKFWQGFDGTNIRHQYAGNGAAFQASAQAADANDADEVRSYIDYSLRAVTVQARDNRFLPVFTAIGNDGDGGSFAPALGTQYRGMVGDWYETRVYDKVLTPDELDEVTAEINTRYGLTQPLWSSLTERDLILIGGQSNAAGPVSIASLPAGYAGEQTGVNIWTGTSYGSTIELLDSTENNNQGAGGGQTGNYGFEMSIGKDYIARVGGSVNLYKYAQGATALANITTSHWLPASTNTLYRGFAREYWLNFYAMQQLNLKPNPIGFAWFQGEQDATELASANAYETNLTEFITSLTPQLAGGEVPWFVCRIANEGTMTYRDTVRTAQSNVATAIDYVTLVDTDDYQMADTVHLGATGQINLGSDLADLL